MSFADIINKLKLPDSKELIESPNKLKTMSKSTDMNTVDVLYFSHDWQKCDLVKGIKKRDTNRPTINLTLPEKLASFESEKSSSFNRTNMRELYLMNEKSPFTIQLDKIPLKTSKINVNASKDDDQTNEVLDIELTQSALSTLGTVRLIDDIDEKTNDGIVVVLVIGVLLGFFINSLLMMFIG